MNELMHKIEALLFSSGRKMELEEISRLCKDSLENIKLALVDLKKRYEEGNSSLKIIEEGNSWKITVREHFMPLVQSIVTQTELSKALMETLAVIAFKYPILQSEVVKIRSNKAYEHLKELEELGYITRAKHGRTNKITLTQKFFDYFELPPEKLKEQFKGFEEIAKAIEEKEKPKFEPLEETQILAESKEETKLLDYEEKKE